MKSLLLLIGSPKPSDSTSESLGNYLIQQMSARNCETKTLFIRPAISTDERREVFLSATDKADIIILASPLYVDSLPYPVTKAMEMIARHRQTSENRNGQQFLCIVNCGFPEAHHNDTAIAICRKFAGEVGFEWAGGLALGGGEAIIGKSLDKLGFMVRNITKSLDLTADDLANGKVLSHQAVTLMAKPLMPAWIYKLIGEFSFKRQAKKHQVYKNLEDCPYQWKS